MNTGSFSQWASTGKPAVGVRAYNHVASQPHILLSCGMDYRSPLIDYDEDAKAVVRANPEAWLTSQALGQGLRLVVDPMAEELPMPRGPAAIITLAEEKRYVPEVGGTAYYTSDMGVVMSHFDENGNFGGWFHLNCVFVKDAILEYRRQSVTAPNPQSQSYRPYMRSGIPRPIMDAIHASLKSFHQRTVKVDAKYLKSTQYVWNTASITENKQVQILWNAPDGSVQSATYQQFFSTIKNNILADIVYEAKCTLHYEPGSDVTPTNAYYKVQFTPRTVYYKSKTDIVAEKLGAPDFVGAHADWNGEVLNANIIGATAPGVTKPGQQGTMQPMGGRHDGRARPGFATFDSGFGQQPGVGRPQATPPGPGFGGQQRPQQQPWNQGGSSNQGAWQGYPQQPQQQQQQQQQQRWNDGGPQSGMGPEPSTGPMMRVQGVSNPTQAGAPGGQASQFGGGMGGFQGGNQPSQAPPGRPGAQIRPGAGPGPIEAQQFNAPQQGMQQPQMLPYVGGGQQMFQQGGDDATIAASDAADSVTTGTTAVSRPPPAMQQQQQQPLQQVGGQPTGGQGQQQPLPGNPGNQMDQIEVSAPLQFDASAMRQQPRQQQQQQQGGGQGARTPGQRSAPGQPNTTPVRQSGAPGGPASANASPGGQVSQPPPRQQPPPVSPVPGQ